MPKATLSPAPQPPLPTRPTAVIAYHEVTADERGDGYTVSRRQLDEHLRVLAGWRRDALPSHPEVLVTYDDGHGSNHRHAFPLLEGHGIKAVFFVIAGHIGIRAEFMTWTQLRELLAAGHEVQAHGWSHVRLTSCSDVRLREELRRAKEALEDRLGSPVDALSIPHGRWDARVLTACGEAGYRRLFTSDPWLPPARREGIDVRGRLMVRRSTDARKLERLLTLEGTPLLMRRARYTVKETVRALLGEHLYHRLWCLLMRRPFSEDFGG